MPSPSEPGAPAPGWYDDGHGEERWWDGFAWTEHVTRTDAAPSVLATTEESGPEPRPSRAWAVWAIAGVVLIGVVIALIVLIPRLLTDIPTASAPSASSPPPSETSTESPVVAYVPVTAEERAAADTVGRYHEAWRTGDCDTYLATTDEAVREAQLFTDCETYVEDTRLNLGWNDDFEVTITEMGQTGTGMRIRVVESYTSRWDMAAEEMTDEPVDYEDAIEYTLVTSAEGWTITEVIDVSE